MEIISGKLIDNFPLLLGNLKKYSIMSGLHLFAPFMNIWKDVPLSRYFAGRSYVLMLSMIIKTPRTRVVIYYLMPH